MLHLFKDDVFPSRDFREDIAVVGKCSPEVQRYVLQWFQQHYMDDSAAVDTSVLANEKDLAADELEQILGTLTYLLHAMDADNVTLAQVQQDLENLQFESGIAVVVIGLLKQLEPMKSRIRFEVLRRIHEESGIATIDDLDIVCDIRPVFADYPSTEPPFDEKHKELLGYTLMAIVQLQVSGRSNADGGAAQHVMFQLNEAALADLIHSLQRAQEQLAVIRRSSSIGQVGKAR